MTFLNPLVLIALAAAAIPILLHLLNLRNLKTVEFSTLAFIKELQRTRIKRLRLRQLLLLLIRTLLVIVSVLAFARPTLTGSFGSGLGSEARTTAVIMFDDSYSMTAADEHGDYLAQAKVQANRILDLLREGDNVYVIRFSEARPGMGESLLPVTDVRAARELIKDIKPAAFFHSLEDVLRIASQVFGQSRNFNKEVYIISDFQTGLVRSDRRPKTPEVLFPPHVRFFHIKLGTRDLRNLGVEQVEIPSALIEPEKPFTVRARIANYAERRVENSVMSVFLGGTRVAQRGVDLESGAARDIEFSVVPKSFGFLEGFVELESDDLEFDNRRWFALHLPEQLQVVLVGRHDDLRYVSLALATRQRTGSTFSIREISPDQLLPQTLRAADVIVLSLSQPLQATQLDHLQRFVVNGGGMILFPGPQPDPSFFNQLARSFNLPLLGGFERAGGQLAGQAVPFFSFDRVEARHPVFQGMFEEERQSESGKKDRSLESPQIKIMGRLAPALQATTIISLTNGVPFLLEQPLGGGRIFIFSVSPTPGWSDFPLKGLFVPLLHRSVSYLAREQLTQESVQAGDPVVVSLPSASGQRVTIRDPQNIEISVPVMTSNAGKFVRFEGTREPGHYSVKVGQSVAATFTVGMNPFESNVLPADASALEELWRRLGIPDGATVTVRQADEIHRRVLESRYGVELWKTLLFGALVLALLEMIVARTGKREVLQVSGEALQTS